MLSRSNVRWVLLLIALFAVFGVGNAQPRNTQVWIQDMESGVLFLVGRGGQEAELTLPVTADFPEALGPVSISNNGQRFAYVMRNPTTGLRALAVYDYMTGAIVLTYTPGLIVAHSIDLSSRFHFNGDGTLLAWGYAFEDGTWEIVLLDLQTLAILSVLRSTDPTAGDISSQNALVPTVMAVRDDGQVAFAMILGFTEGLPVYDAYLWNPTAGTVTPTLGYVTPSSDLFPLAGEVVMAIPDDNFSSDDEGFPFGGHINAMAAFLTDSAARVTFYHDPVNSLAAPRFAYSGQLIAALQVPPIEPPQPNSLIILSREGVKLADLLTSNGSVDYLGTPEGLAVIAPDGDTGMPALRFIDVRAVTPVLDLAESLVWRGVQNRFYALRWAGVLGENNPYSLDAPLPGWGALSDPLYEIDALLDMGSTDTGGGTTGTGGGAPTTPTAGLTIGGVATVRTTGGDALNMRTNAGTEFQIVRKLDSGTEVTLLEGPVSAAGFTWWRVQTADGLTGWVVDAASGVQTLVPGRTATSGEIDEASEGAASLPSVLSVGRDAVVTLTARGDSLRLRNAPSLSGRIVILLPNGTRVRVVGGPQSADGYTWWEIRTPEGNIGWAAEVIGNERVLVGQ